MTKDLFKLPVLIQSHLLVERGRRIAILAGVLAFFVFSRAWIFGAGFWTFPLTLNSLGDLFGQVILAFIAMIGTSLVGGMLIFAITLAVLNGVEDLK